MKVSVNWLRELAGFSWPVNVLSDRLAELGFLTESVTQTGVSIPKVVSAKILSIEKHPNADRLSVAQVDDGSGARTVVCGATNIAVGQVVPLAKPGAKLKGGLEISVTKIRGVESHGMLCSERELGLSETHEGIFQLPPEAKPGRDLAKILGTDTVLDLEIPPNRPDVMSHIGLARELSVLLGKKLKLPLSRWKPAASGAPCKIEIRETKLCRRYMGKIIHGVKVGPSPDWMAQRLSACGIRPINNIVDITNYALLEWGHPLHAFDLSKLSGQQIVVRRARGDEKIEALDGLTYTLTNEDLVIADGERPVAIAGIMGGQSTGVGPDTVDVLLESAVFLPSAVRVTSKRLGLKSESSLRFEKGTDPATAQSAALRAAQLMLELAGGRSGKASDVYPKKETPLKVRLNQKKLNSLVGMPIKKEQVQRILTNLEFKVQSRKDEWICAVPPHRKDVSCDADVVEEALRFFGYNKVPASLSAFRLEQTGKEARVPMQDEVATVLKGWGLHETITSSMSSIEVSQLVGRTPDQLVTLANPLSQEETVLRSCLIPNLLRAVRRNIYNQRDNVALFEIGSRHFFDKSINQPGEELVLALAIHGSLQPVHWKGASEDADLYTLKGLLEKLGQLLDWNLRFRFPTQKPFLHPRQSFEISNDFGTLGCGGVLHPSVANFYGLKKTCVVMEMKLDFNRTSSRKFEEFPRFPFVERDVAVVVSAEATWGSIEEWIRRSGGDLLKDVVPFDIFKGGSLEADKRSIAFRCRLQPADRTLTDQEINATMDRIKTVLVERCDAQLR